MEFLEMTPQGMECPVCHTVYHEDVRWCLRCAGLNSRILNPLIFQEEYREYKRQKSMELEVIFEDKWYNDRF
jgi:hypothetical protein